MTKPCGYDDCAVSTAIDETTLTFGRGKLDDFGFWEILCLICAAEHKREYPKDLVWPKGGKS